MANNENKFLQGVNVGIVAESTDNLRVCIAYSNKILLPLKRRLKVYIENYYITQTQVLPEQIKHIDKFYLTGKKHSPRFIIIFTDRDGNKQLRSDLEREVSKYEQKFVIALPKENIEDWLISDIGAINKTLGTKISGSRSRDRNIDPKIWLSGIIGQAKTEDNSPLTPAQIYKKISEASNIKLINSGFPTFAATLRSLVKELDPIRKNKKPARVKMSKKIRRSFNQIRRTRPLLPKDRRRN